MLTKLHINSHVSLTALVIALGLALAVSLSSIAGAAPVDVLKGCDSGSKVCAGTDKNSLNSLLTNVVNLLLTVGGIIAVIMIIVGGIRYTTSNGDSGQVSSAKDTIIYAVVGLVIAIMSFAIVNFVLTEI